jgi:uncharacterized protein YndB with AHSA1/START domain
VGALTPDEGSLYELRFERFLPHPVPVVWRAISEPGQLAHWFPGLLDIDLTVGGAVRFAEPAFEVDPDIDPTRGTVIAVEPPHLLAFTWGDEPLRFELVPTVSGCNLTFSHGVRNRAGRPRFAAGWHVCLDRLARSLDPDAPARSWLDYFAFYESEFGRGATSTRSGSDGIVRLERLLPSPAEAVWAALTEPLRLADWLADAAIDPRVGGRVALHLNGPANHLVSGQITQLRAPSVLEYSWIAQGEPDGSVRWVLIPIEDRCLLLLTHTLHGAWDAGPLAAWDVYLDGLAGALLGRVSPFDEDRWRVLQEHYAGEIAEHG